MVIGEIVKGARYRVRKDFLSHIGGLGLGPTGNEKTEKGFNHENLIGYVFWKSHSSGYE